MRLELGVRERRDRYITVDGQHGANYLAHIPPLPDAVFDYTFDMVEAYHFWEHLYLWEAEQLAREVCSVLAPGGVLILELPNLAKCCEMILHPEKIPVKDDAPRHPDPRFTVWGIYGDQEGHAGNVFQAHKWGYTPESLMKQLLDAGFKKAQVLPPTRGQWERDMRIEAYK